MFCTTPAHLLDGQLEFNGYRGHVGGHGLEPRCWLTIEFLHQKVQPLAGRSTGLQDALHLIQMRGQTRQLLGHIDTLGKQPDLQTDTIIVKGVAAASAAGLRAFPDTRPQVPERG